MKFLRHKETGIIDGYSAAKAELECMEEITREEAEAAEAGKTQSEEVDDGSRMKSIITAIKSLDRNDPDAFTAAGKPQVKAIEEVLGDEITASERDEAYASISD